MGTHLTAIAKRITHPLLAIHVVPLVTAPVEPDGGWMRMPLDFESSGGSSDAASLVDHMDSLDGEDSALEDAASEFADAAHPSHSEAGTEIDNDTDCNQRHAGGSDGQAEKADTS